MRKAGALAAAVALVLAGAVVPAATASSDGEDTRVLVQFRGSANASERGQQMRAHNAKKVDEVYGADVWVVESERGESARQLARRMAQSRSVVYAEVDEVLTVSVDAPNDPSFSQQYAHERIRSIGGWTAYPGTYNAPAGPTIAIIDSGVNRSHPEFAGRIDTSTSRCFGTLCLFTGYEDDNGHGTHVAGIAAAATNNGTGIAGVAFNARLMALKVCNVLGSCFTADVVSAINWARQNGAHVINMSLGGGGTSTMANAVRDAWNAGVVIVAAAGNDGNSSLSYPASYPEVISVAATTSSDARASYSNFNDQVELAAPGSSILSTYTGGGYATLSGTSMASPHVAGLAALVRGQNPSWSNQQVRNRMNACADDLGAAGRDPQYGHGRINSERTLGTC